MIPLEGFRYLSRGLYFHWRDSDIFPGFIIPQEGDLNTSIGIITPQEGHLNPSSGIINPLEG